MQSYLTGWYALHGAGRRAVGRHDARARRRQRGRARSRRHRCRARASGDRRGVHAREAGTRRVAWGDGDDRQLDPRRGRRSRMPPRRSPRRSTTVPTAAASISCTTLSGEVGEVAVRALGEDGQYLVIGFVAGIPKLPANQVLLRNRRITGVDWGAWVGRNQDANRALLGRRGRADRRGRSRPCRAHVVSAARCCSGAARPRRSQGGRQGGAGSRRLTVSWRSPRIAGGDRSPTWQTVAHMVVIAQQVEHQVVILAVGGSSPLGHPIRRH